MHNVHKRYGSDMAMASRQSDRSETLELAARFSPFAGAGTACGRCMWQTVPRTARTGNAPCKGGKTARFRPGMADGTTERACYCDSRGNAVSEAFQSRMPTQGIPTCLDSCLCFIRVPSVAIQPSRPQWPLRRRKGGP